jgi:hypothetical protein
MEIAMKIERPRPLASKKCNDMFSAACDHCPLLKLSGHKGISVSVYLQDGLFAAPLGKRMHARHNLFFKHCPLSFDAPADKELCEMQDWCLAWCCIAHSCSRALKWGLKSLVSDNGMLESVHITISSLLRASTGIHQAVPQFIISWAVSSYCITAALHKEDVVGCVCFGRSKHCGTAAAHTSKKFHVVFCNHLRLKLNAL